MNTLSWVVKLHKRNGNQSQHLKYIFPYYTFITILTYPHNLHATHIRKDCTQMLNTVVCNVYIIKAYQRNRLTSYSSTLVII